MSSSFRLVLSWQGNIGLIGLRFGCLPIIHSGHFRTYFGPRQAIYRLVGGYMPLSPLPSVVTGQLRLCTKLDSLNGEIPVVGSPFSRSCLIKFGVYPRWKSIYAYCPDDSFAFWVAVLLD